MNGFDAFCLFSSLKMHFNTTNYDFFKYGGKIKATVDSYEKRKDKLNFYRLSKKKDTQGLIVSNLILNNNLWVTDCLTVEAETNYKNWIAIQQSLLYRYKNDLEILHANFDSNFIVVDHNYPHLLTLYHYKKINLETVIILNRLVNFIPMWNKKINVFDSVLWPEEHLLFIKYSPFVQLDVNKAKQLTLNHYQVGS